MEQKPDIHELRKSYDAAAKRLLSYKEVIANILKYTVREFKGPFDSGNCCLFRRKARDRDSSS